MARHTGEVDEVHFKTEVHLVGVQQMKQAQTAVATASTVGKRLQTECWPVGTQERHSCHLQDAYTPPSQGTSPDDLHG